MESLKVMPVAEYLNQWGCWVRSGRQLPGLTDTQRRQAGAGSSLTDDEALAIDQAIAQLKYRDPEMGRVVFAYHATVLPIRSVAKVMKLNVTKAAQLLKSGEAWVDGFLQTKKVV